MDRSTSKMFEELGKAIQKEIKTLLLAEITDLQNQYQTYVEGVEEEEEFYRKKLKKLKKVYEGDIISHGEVVKFSIEHFIGSYNNERDIALIKEEYEKEGRRKSLIKDRALYYVKAEIIEFLRRKSKKQSSNSAPLSRATIQEGDKIIQTTTGALEGMVEEAVERRLQKENRTDKDGEVYFTAEEAATFLKIAKQTLYGYTSKNLISHIKRGKFIYFKKSELVKLLEAGRKKTIKENQEEAINSLQNSRRKK